MRAAGGEDGGDEGVGAAEQLVQPGVRAAQRTAVHGQRRWRRAPRSRRTACPRRRCCRSARGPGRRATPTVGRPSRGSRGRGRRTPASSRGSARSPRRSAARCRRGTGPARPGWPGRPRRGTAAPRPRPRRARTTRPSARRPARSRRRAATVGTPDALSAASPSSQARLPPSSRTTAMSAPSSSAGSSCRDVDAGRVADPVVGAGSGPGRQQIGVGGRQQQHCAHAGAPGGMKGSPCGAPDSISRRQRVRVRVLFDQVAEPVELLLAQRGEGGVGGRHEPAARGGRHLAQEGPPEAVRLQRAVPVRAPGLSRPGSRPGRSSPSEMNGSPPVTSATPWWISYPSTGSPRASPDRPGEGLLPARTAPARAAARAPRRARAGDSTSSSMCSPRIWKPPQMPSTGRPSAARARRASARPRSRSHSRALTVPRVPGTRRGRRRPVPRAGPRTAPRHRVRRPARRRR